MKLASITVRNAQRLLPVKIVSLQKFSEQALALCLKQSRRSLSVGHLDIILVSDRRIAALHKKFMNIPGPTDVITFQHGEIFISIETAKRQARRFRTTTEHEVRLYLVHGLLHLLGFDDKTPTQARRMEATQTAIMASVAGAVG